MPRVSVISGAYNISPCYSFEKSMKSILEQTFCDFEFIICDDGSTDDTWALLTEFSRKDPRIKLIRNEKNIGLAASLNRCIEIASGEYIARHDCDDVSAPERLEKQVKFLDENKEIAVLGTNSFVFDKSGVWGKLSFPTNIKNESFLFSSPHIHGSVVFRKDALMKAGGYRVAKETRRTEDYDLFMNMHLFSKSANLPEFLYYFCEDKNTLKRRKYRYRIDEAKVRFKGFKRLGLLPRGIPYAIKPLAVGLIPRPILKRMRKRSWEKRNASTDTD